MSTNYLREVSVMELRDVLVETDLEIDEAIGIMGLCPNSVLGDDLPNGREQSLIADLKECGLVRDDMSGEWTETGGKGRANGCN